MATLLQDLIGYSQTGPTNTSTVNNPVITPPQVDTSGPWIAAGVIVAIIGIVIGVVLIKNKKSKAAAASISAASSGITS